LTDNVLHNEKAILRQVALGDEQAYKELFVHYWGRVYSIALLFAKVPEVAEDAAQDVFAQLWVKRELLINVLDFRSYLYTTAKNLIYNKLRTRIYAGEFNDYLQEYFADPASGPQTQLEIKEANRIVEEGIRTLTPQQEKVFRLSRFQGLSHEEIAQQTGLSKRTVKNYMVSAILTLRKYLEQHPNSFPIFLWIVLFL